MTLVLLEKRLFLKCLTDAILVYGIYSIFYAFILQGCVEYAEIAPVLQKLELMKHSFKIFETLCQ